MHWHSLDLTDMAPIKELVAMVHSYLDDLVIACHGRYGDWGYMWTDESFQSGERAARNVLSFL